MRTIREALFLACGALGVFGGISILAPHDAAAQASSTEGASHACG